MLFQEAKPEAAYLKLGIYGEAGSGKTFTASLVAIGLHEFIKSTKPVGFADTETGSDYVQKMFKKAGIKLMVKKSRVFEDLLKLTDEAEKEFSVFIIDSISHFWIELQEAFMKANDLKRINWIKHSAPIKHIWRDFTERFLNSRLHIIVCGRSSPIYEDIIDEEDGSKETKKTGTKMKTENELGHEPSLLTEMTSVQLSPNFGGKLVRRLLIKKDRFDEMDGQIFDNPTFKTFLPHVENLNLGGEHRGIETGRDSTGLIQSDRSGEQRMLNRDILLEKIESEITLRFPGQTKEDRTAKLKMIESLFTTNSWKEVEKKVPVEILSAGYEKLKAERMATEGVQA